MIFALVILILIGVIAFFHYTQGFWSATLSALVAVIASLIAINFHESLANLLVSAKMVNQAHSVMLVLTFAITYVALRFAFDKMIPGNIRLPAIVDKVGGGAMGVIAGIFATGILALAAQALPFGPKIAGYSRFELEDSREVSIAGAQGRQMIDTSVEDELSETTLDPAKSSGVMIIPVDNIVLALAEKQSSTGALAGSQPLASIHPNYADELFANRLGIETGAERAALNVGGKEHVKVDGVFRLSKIGAQVDGEVGTTRSGGVSWPNEAPSGQMFFVVRAMFDQDAADDKDKLFRFSPASVRLVTKNTEGKGWHDYHPIGTLENGVLVANKPDDFLFVDFAQGSGADLVFLVAEPDVLENPRADVPKVADGVFIEVKRMARQDLSDMEVKTGVPATPTVQLLRKPSIANEIKAKGGAAPAATAKPGAGGGTSAAGGAAGGASTGAPAGGTPAPGASSSPLTVKQAQVTAQLFSPINTGTPEKNANNVQVASGTLSLKDGKFSKLDITPVQTLTLMKQGSYTVSELFVPEGQRMVQISAEPPADSGADAWAWADQFDAFKLKDDKGQAYSARGAFARVRSGREDRMIAVYDANSPITGVSRDENRPIDVYLAFLIPAGTNVKSLDFNNAPIQTFALSAP